MKEENRERENMGTKGREGSKQGAMKLVDAIKQSSTRTKMFTRNGNEKDNKRTPPSPTYMAHYAFKALSYVYFITFTL